MKMRLIFLFIYFTLVNFNVFAIEDEFLKNRINRCQNREISNCESKEKVCLCYDNKSNIQCDREKLQCIINIGSSCSE